MYAGRITVGVRAKNAGKATVYAYSEGLLTAALDIEVLPKPETAEAISSPVSADKVEAGHV